MSESTRSISNRFPILLWLNRKLSVEIFKALGYGVNLSSTVVDERFKPLNDIYNQNNILESVRNAEMGQAYCVELLQISCILRLLICSELFILSFAFQY